MLEPGNPAGGGYSTARDLLAFAQALDQRKLLDSAMTELLLHGTFSGVGRPKYGYGLREEIVNGRRFVGNSGGAPGVNAEFRFEPAGSYAVVVLSNYNPPSATVALQHVLSWLPVGATP
jgi:CubicO group peptidase (beta-lactamase class C family)